METLVNLDPDVEALLRAQVSERNLDFDRALNDAVRAGLSQGANSAQSSEPPRFVQKTYPMGAEDHFNVVKALALADQLEDEEIIRKMKLAEGR